MIEYAEGELFQILEDDGRLSLEQVKFSFLIKQEENMQNIKRKDSFNKGIKKVEC